MKGKIQIRAGFIGGTLSQVSHMADILLFPTPIQIDTASLEKLRLLHIFGGLNS